MDRCTLCSIGGIPIDGSGPLNAKILIIGEAPNQEEDRRREYFKGKAGDMLTESLTKVGLSRDHVRLENALACRPPSNRTPTDDEIAACRPRLFKLIEQVNPTVIMPLGYVALKAIEGGGSIRKRQGIPKKVNGRWVIPAMHPAFYLIRNGLGSEDLVDALGIARDYAYPTDLNKSYTLLNQIDLITEWYDYVKGDCTRLAMDIESQNLALDAPWLGIGFAYRTGGAVYIPLRTGSFFQRSRRKGDAEKKGGKKKKALVDIVDFWPANIMPKVLGIISDILTSGTFKITTHNGGYDLRRLSYEGDAYDFQHTWAFDTYLADYLLNENKFLDERALGHLTTRYLDLNGFKDETKGYQDFASIPLETLADRCMMDVDGTLRETYRMAPLIEEQGLDFMMYEFMLKVQSLLSTMENNGVYVNQEHLSKLLIQEAEELKKLDQRVFGLAGKVFNLNANEQVGKLLFDEINIGEPIKVTDKTGVPSVDEEHLKHFKDAHPIVPVIMARVSKKKELETFEGYAKAVQADGAMHTHYNIARTVTGRLSSENPNLQNPKRDPNVRRVFSAPPGWGLINADYSQAEVRWLADYSEDPTLMNAFNTGRDIHCHNTAICYGLDYDEVYRLYKAGDPEIYAKRTGIKSSLTFGVIYGMGDQELAKSIRNKAEGESIEDALVRAKQFKVVQAKAFQAVEVFRDKVHTQILDTGCIQSIYGRTRRLPEVFTDDEGQKARALRQGFNFIIQSASSDMTMMTMYDVWRAIIAEGLGGLAKPVLTVHDSLVFQVSLDVVLDVIPIIKEIGGRKPHPEAKVPMVIDIDIEKSWTLPLQYHIESGGQPLCGCQLGLADALAFKGDNRVPDANWCSDCKGVTK